MPVKSAHNRCTIYNKAYMNFLIDWSACDKLFKADNYMLTYYGAEYHGEVIKLEIR